MTKEERAELRCSVNFDSLGVGELKSIALMLLDELEVQVSVSAAERAVVDAALERHRVTYSDDREEFADACVALVKAVEALLNIRSGP